MSCGIYQIVNTTNGHIYIGSSSDVKRRWNEHRSKLDRNIHENSHLQNAWNKYSESAFEFDKLITCPEDLLIFYEQQFIDKGKPEYNLYPTAGSPRGSVRTLEQRHRMSARLKGNTYTLGYKHTKETRKKMSEAGKRRPFPSKVTRSKLHKASLGNKYGTGHIVSNEHKEILRKCNRGESNSQSKLTEQDVLHIRYIYHNIKITHEEIAKQYGLARRSIGDVIQGRNWKYLPLVPKEDSYV